MMEPTFADVLDAKRTIAKYLKPTPFFKSIPLSGRLGFEAYVKYENLQPIGAFKIRGGINLISKLSEDEKRLGVITASTGNHGLSIAYASALFGVKAIIGAPVGSNPYKIQMIRDLGAAVALHGKDFDEARLWVENEAREKGYRYIHSANEPLLIAGVGTLYLEILEELPDVDTIFVPVGGGSGASGACIVAKTINPSIKVIGVQSEGAPAVYESWKKGKMIETTKIDTFADGLATRVPFEMTMNIMRRLIDEIILVSEKDLKQAIRLLLETTHQVAEGAGAASTAGAIKMSRELKAKKVALVISGGNLTLDIMRDIVLKEER
jgi:threonine dehydratase